MSISGPKTYQVIGFLNGAAFPLREKKVKLVKVEIWSDFVCPWCWIAKRRFESVAKALAEEIQVAPTYKSYRLSPGMVPTGFKAALAKKFGSARAAEELMAMVSKQAALDGLIYNFSNMKFGDTTDVHALVKSVASPTLQGLLIDRVFHAYISEGFNIFDRAVLQEIALQSGILSEQVDLDLYESIAAIEREEAEATRITGGVPLFVFNSKFVLSGAQPIEVFEQVLRRAAEESLATVTVANAGVCESEGCRI